MVIWVCIAGILFKAVEGVSRYVWNGWSTLGYEAMQAHEDPVLIASILFLMLALLIFGGNRGQLRVMLLLALPLLLGFYVGQRRAAYGSLIVAFVTYVALVPPRHMLKSLRVIAPVVIMVMAYIVMFWESSSTLAGPINQVRSGLARDDEAAEVVKDKEYYSNLYRKIEDYDLAVTIQGSPALGIGFGTKYEQPVRLARLEYALMDFMAHNNIIWLLAKVGAVGFFLFWLFMNSLALKGASLLGRMEDPYLKAVCLFILVAAINLLTAAYFDLHLVRYRTMLFLGTLLGLLSTIEQIDLQTQWNKIATRSAPRRNPI
jgi:hypothetical protein